MRRSFLVVLTVSVGMLMAIPVSRVAAQSDTGVPQALSNIQNSLNAISGDVSALQSSVDSIINGGASCKLRRYYVTEDTFDGSQALTACETGFHMANLFEILDVSGLQYDTSLGKTQDDSGFGPPTHYAGWIRTGYISSVGTGPQQLNGRANCSAWTSNDSGHYGTWMYLKNTWNYQPGEPANERVAPWIVSLTESCDTHNPVWCVENP